MSRYGVVERDGGFAVMKDGYLLSINGLMMDREKVTYNGEYKITHKVDVHGSRKIVIYADINAALRRVEELKANEPPPPKPQSEVSFYAMIIIGFIFSIIVAAFISGKF